MSDNQYAGQKVVELVMDSGETVYVKPLSIPLLYGLMEKSVETFPYPDPKPYETKIDPALTLEPGQVIPASHNADYRALCAQVDEQRRRWQNVQVVLLCVMVEDKAALTRKYADDLTRIGKIIDLPLDNWEAVLLYCILSSAQDYSRIVLAANGSMIVNEEDVRGAWRIFRPDLQGTRPTRRGRPPKSSGVEPDNGPEA